MRSLPQPRYLSYALTGESHGLTTRLLVINHLVWVDIQKGDAPVVWQMRHRTADYSSEIVEAGERYVSQRAFFDPTWYGAYRALRDGMLDYQDATAPQSESENGDLRTIAVVTVMGPSVYNVTDAGAATCSNGDEGHALHLTPRRADPKHQLSDVVVDLRRTRFCMIRFSVEDSFGFHGSVEQHYGDVGGYWLQTDGVIAGGAGSWRYRLSDVTFPRSLPDSIFVPPETQSGFPAPGRRALRR